MCSMRLLILMLITVGVIHVGVSVKLTVSVMRLVSASTLATVANLKKKSTSIDIAHNYSYCSLFIGLLLFWKLVTKSLRDYFSSTDPTQRRVMSAEDPNPAATPTACEDIQGDGRWMSLVCKIYYFCGSYIVLCFTSYRITRVHYKVPRSAWLTMFNFVSLKYKTNE